MRVAFALLICGLIAASGLPEKKAPVAELFYLYRDDHDRRGVAEVRARLEGRALSLEIRSHGPEIEAPVGYEGFRGENLQTAHELERGLERGTLRFFTLHAASDRVDVTRRDRFRIRVHDEALRRVVERETEASRIRALVYSAELEATAAPRPLRLEVRVGGAPRLVLHGRQDPEGGALVRFERFQDYGPVVSAAFFPPQEPPAGPGTESVETLVRQLSDDSLEKRREAARKLAARGPKILSELERFANDSNLETRGAVRQVARTIRRTEAERGLTGDDPDGRAQALRRIADVEGKDIFKVIEENPDPKYIAALTDLVVFELSTATRGKAVDALLKIGTPKIFPALLFGLRNPWNHGEPIVSWLGAHGDLTVLGELERGEGEKPAPVAEIIDRLRSRFPRAKPQEPKEWTPIDPAPFFKAIGDGKTPADRIRGIRGATNSGSHGGDLPRALSKALADPDEEVRFRAAEAFTFAGVGEEGDRLESVYKDAGQSLRTRQMTAVALARTGEEATRSRMVASLADGPAELRITLAGALGDTGDSKIVEALKALAGRESDAAVRAAIEKAVQRIREIHRKR